MKSVRLKRSSVANKKPSVSGASPDLDYGDLALNFNSSSPTLFSRGHDDTLLEWHAGLELPPTTRAGDVLTLGATGTATPVPQWKTPPAPVMSVTAAAPLHATGSADVALAVDAATAATVGVVRLADAAAITAGTAGRVVDAAQLKAATPPDASETVKGIVELATAAETTTGTDATRAVHPAGLKVELDKKANQATTYTKTETDAALALKAPLASPALTGVPTAPTAAAGTNTTQVATTQFVTAAVAVENLWNRTGTVVSPTTAGDSVFTTGAVKVGGTTAAPKIEVKADGGIVANTNGLVYDAATKRLAIGASSPRELLDVNGNIRFGASAVSRIYSLNASQGSIQISAPNKDKYNSVSYGNNYYLNSSETWVQDASNIGGSAIELRAPSGDYGGIFFRQKQDSGSGGAERIALHIAGNGNVGFGVTGAATSVHLSSPTLTDNVALRIQRSSGAADPSNAGLQLNIDGTNYGRIYVSSTGDLTFAGHTSDFAAFDHSGRFMVGTSTSQGSYNIQCYGTGVWGQGAYVNGSDANIKKNIQDLEPALDVIKAMRPVTFQYKQEYSSDQTIQPGFIAQELQTAMAGKAYVDGVVQQGATHLNVAYSSIIAVLVKAVQELEAKVAALETP